MTMQHPPSAVWLALALPLLHAACGEDKEPAPDKTTRDGSVSSSPDGDDDDDDSTGTGTKDGGATNPRDAATDRRDARSDTNTGSDASGGKADSGAGETNDGGQTAEPTACDPSAAPAIPPLALETVVSGLSGLTYAAQAPGASEWYLLQQSGQVRVFKDGALLPAPFLDVSAEIPRLMSLPQDERGLLGIAFPPDYASSGKFYIMMTPVTGDDMNRDVVREYQRSSANPLVANPTPSKTIVRLDASDFNHDGGSVVFGPDGMLYVGTGDGGGSCNSSKRGAPQDTKTLFGKILRLDVAGSSPDFAATGNPFASGGDARVLHYGLRNPFRFSFDRATDDLYIGDVGQDAYEELDVAPKGKMGLNFGWPAFEGETKSSGSGGTCATSALAAGSTHTAPIASFDRRSSATGDFRDYKSVIGGHVYRGSALPALQGVYIFGDFQGARMGALRRCGEQTSKITPIAKNRDPNAPDAPSFSRPNGDSAFSNLTSIVIDNAGELYFTANFDRLYKVVPRK